MGRRLFEPLQSGVSQEHFQIVSVAERSIFTVAVECHGLKACARRTLALRRLMSSPTTLSPDSPLLLPRFPNELPVGAESAFVVLGFQGLVEGSANLFCQAGVAKLAGSVSEQSLALDFLAVGDAGVEGESGFVEVELQRFGGHVFATPRPPPSSEGPRSFRGSCSRARSATSSGCRRLPGTRRSPSWRPPRWGSSDDGRARI